jgi:hypothetical protein
MILSRYAAGTTGGCWETMAMLHFREHYKVRGRETLMRKFDESVTLLASPAIGRV